LNPPNSLVEDIHLIFHNGCIIHLKECRIGGISSENNRQVSILIISNDILGITVEEIDAIGALHAQLALTQRAWVISVVILFLFIIFLLSFVYLRNYKTKKIAAEQAAKLSAMTARVEAMINNLPGVVYQNICTMPYYTCTFVSEGCLELTGYSVEEIVGNSGFKFLDIVHPDDVGYLLKHGEETLAKGLPAEVTYRIIARDGTEKWIWERSRVIEKNPDGTPHIMEGYYTDITERRQLESAELASRAKSDFLAVMSHEIRTPMNSILGFAELAEDIVTTPKVRDYLRKITDNAKWLLNIINDILDISKIESGKMELDITPFDLRDTILHCQSVIMPNIKEKGLKLSIYTDPSIEKILLGDQVRLHQVLLNLLSNAVKFTNSGIVNLSAVVKESNDNNTTIYFEVKDSGIGMTPKQAATIFDPFIQAESSTTRKYGGTGLGLAIVKNIVELMGGNLSVESLHGVGSVFSFEITFETVEASNDTNGREKLDILEKPYFNGLVLVCDDNRMNQEVICEHLERVGVKADVADNGKIGVEMLEDRLRTGERPYDLIFMDMFMPVMDGMEAASKIMSLGAGIPIVAMTANVMASEVEKYKKSGMPDCLGKPFTSQELWRVLLKYLKPAADKADGGTRNDAARGTHELRDVKIENTFLISFVKNNQTMYAEITDAIESGNITLAHRLAHSLKGNAGFIGRTKLQEYAGEVESLLKEGNPVPEALMDIFRNELTLALEELRPLLD